MTYTLHCSLCQAIRPITRAEVETFAVGQCWPTCHGEIMYLKVGKERP